MEVQLDLELETKLEAGLLVEPDIELEAEFRDDLITELDGGLEPWLEIAIEEADVVEKVVVGFDLEVKIEAELDVELEGLLEVKVEEGWGDVKLDDRLDAVLEPELEVGFDTDTMLVAEVRLLLWLDTVLKLDADAVLELEAVAGIGMESGSELEGETRLDVGITAGEVEARVEVTVPDGGMLGEVVRGLLLRGLVGICDSDRIGIVTIVVLVTDDDIIIV